MADDIDIEEHDILDNPRIQDILRIKDEPVEDAELYEEPYDEYNQYEYYNEEYNEGTADDQIPYDQPPDDQEPTNDQEPPNNSEPDPSEMVYDDEDLNFNETDADSDESISESGAQVDYVPDLSNEIYHHKNKIILGTKPCRRPERDINGAYVDLEDWGVRLENSNCYCKECETLFATRNALDAHNMIAHSFLVALDSPESSESETPAVPEKTDTAKYCDHCKKYFPNDHALIQHLYDLITANKPTPVNKPPQTTVKYSDCTNTGQHMVYSCLICNSAYLDIKWFKFHVKNVHNKTEKGTYEQIPFTGVCKICQHTSVTLKRFNIHVKIHIDKNELLPYEPIAENSESQSTVESENVELESQVGLESETEDSDTKKPTEPRVRGPKVVTIRNEKSKFMCIKCKTYYSNRNSIAKHRKRYHNGANIIKVLRPMSMLKTLLKMPLKMVAAPQKVSVVKSPEVSKNLKFVDNLVPTSCIFKCAKCKIHFITCWSAILHNCTDMISRFQCDVCCLQFRLKDNKIHETQHKHNDAFTTYLITKNMSTRMLFWCQKCAVYFELRKIQSHATACKGTSSSVRCKLCEIDVNDVLAHMNHHKIHPTKSDFIFIDDILPYDVEETPQEKDLKRILPIDKTGFEVTSPGLKSGDLKRKLPMDKSDEPGPSKMKKLGPNEYIYCELCRACMKKSARGCHTTGECKDIKGKKNCEFCGLLFFAGTPVIYHEEIHKQSKPKFKDFTFVNVLNYAPIVPLIPDFPKCERCDTQDFCTHECGDSKTCKTCNKKFSEAAYKLHALHHKYLRADTEVDALIKKYEMLTSTWNILYLCKTCNVATDSYDDVVVHCQNHYNNIQNYSVRNCEYCVLNLEETCHKRHRELHSPGITRESFKTVVYDYKNLLNEDWLKLFGTLSEAEVHQIVTRSIYVTRFVKMKLILDGPPELTIYKCETCKLYVDPHAIYNHTTLCVTNQDMQKKSYACETCLIPFSTATARKDHEKLHTTPNITANSFRIVAFNSKTDREFNLNLQVDSESSEFKPKTPINVHPIKVKSNVPKSADKVVLLYQCRQCKSCSPQAESLIRHKCLLGDEIVKCKKCHLDIPSTTEKEHRKWHAESNVSKECIKLSLIDNKVLTKRKHVDDDAEKKEPICKLHQCRKCKVCYSFWVKHPVCTAKNRRCKRCGYLFTPKSYVLHNIWHELNKQATKRDIRVVPLTPEQSAKSKAEKIKFKKFIRENVDTDDVESLPADDEKIKVYQCHKCKICSYRVAYVKRHTICLPPRKDTYHCKICDLKFKYISMKYHKAWHSENKNRDRRYFKILPFKGTKILKVKDETVKIAKKKEDSSKNIVSSDDGYSCKKCGASSKKSIFVKKHTCKVSPEKPKASPYVYYQCENCEACSTSTRHFCMPAHRIRVCPKCKLKFTVNSIFVHMQKHATHKNMTRSKIKVVPLMQRVQKPEEAVTKPVDKVSIVYRCSCGLHFISQKTIERHFTTCSPDQDIPSENCSKCGLLFPTNHLVSHLCNHHSYGKGNIEVKTIATVTYYRCGSCKCLFMNESRALKHNKRCEPDDRKSVLCDECDLDFHESEVKTHKDTHITMSDLNNPCRIVTVNKNTQHVDSNKHIEFETNDSDEENESKPDEILRKVPTKCSLKGVQYDNRLYRCNACNTHFLKHKSFLRHLNRQVCNDEEKPACSLCDLIFSQISLTRHVSIQHEKLGLELNDFVINVCDSLTGKIQSKVTPKRNTTTESKAKDNSSDETVDLFKCHICDVHFLKVISLKHHIQSGSHTGSQIKCSRCGIKLLKNSLQMHLSLHHRDKKLQYENYNIIEKREFEQVSKDEENKSLTPNAVKDESCDDNISQEAIEEPSETTIIDEETEDIVYYNCVKCQLHFTNTRSLEVHFQGQHIRNSIEKCDMCGLAFNTLTKHKQHHEGKSSGVFLIQDIDDESKSVNKLFKCQECGLHFMKPQTLIAHLKGVHVTKSSHRINCPDCGLFFTKITLRQHQMLHHEAHSLSLEDLVIDTSVGKYRTHKFGSVDNDMVPQSSSEGVNTDDNNSMDIDELSQEKNDPDVSKSNESVNKSPNGSTKLYKCGKCNVYFLTQATCYKHIVKHTPMDPKEYIECKLCSFQFRIVSLNTHIRKHHKTDFAFDKVLIEEYQPKTEEEKAPKIDIYYAKDKVQSLLVSTTTDDNVDNSEVSQSELDSIDDPDASNHSKETVILTNNDSLDTEPEVDIERKDVMVKIPSFTDIKEESDNIEDAYSGSKINEHVTKTESLESNETPSKNGESSENVYSCGYCSETFVNRRAKDFHESLDHLDALKDCPVCKKSFNTSVLNELHLQIKNETFTCCVCSQNANVTMLPHHSFIHNNNI